MSSKAIKKARERRFKILKIIKERGMMTRRNIIECLDEDVPDTTVWDDLDWLASNGYIETKGRIADGSRGSPPTYWRAKDIGKAEKDFR